MNEENIFKMKRRSLCPYCHANQYQVTYTVQPSLLLISGVCENCGFQGHSYRGTDPHDGAGSLDFSEMAMQSEAV